MLKWTKDVKKIRGLGQRPSEFWCFANGKIGSNFWTQWVYRKLDRCRNTQKRHSRDLLLVKGTLDSAKSHQPPNRPHGRVCQLTQRYLRYHLHCYHWMSANISDMWPDHPVTHRTRSEPRLCIINGIAIVIEQADIFVFDNYVNAFLSGGDYPILIRAGPMPYCRYPYLSKL